MEEIITQLQAQELAPATGGKPKQLVILLHGLGSDGKDLIGLAPEFADILPDAQFLSPDAPFNCDMSPFGYQWFSLASGFSDRLMYQGAQDVAPILNNYIDSQLQRFGLQDKDLALIGFSQGTMMSLHIALRREESCAGVLGYSGKLLDYEPLENQIKSKPKIALVHGVMDPVVPFSSMEDAKDALEKVGVDTQITASPLLAHGIDLQGIEFGKKFLKQIFD